MIKRESKHSLMVQGSFYIHQESRQSANEDTRREADNRIVFATIVKIINSQTKEGKG